MYMYKNVNGVPNDIDKMALKFLLQLNSNIWHG